MQLILKSRLAFLITSFLFSSLIFNGQAAISIEKQQALADSLYNNREFEKAAEAYELLFSQIAANDESKAKAAFAAGRSNGYLGHHQKAMSQYETAAKIFLEIGNQDNHFVTLSRIASIKDDNGEYDQAIALSEKIVGHFISKKDSVPAANNLSDLALYRYNKGETQKSIDTYLKALSLFGNKELSAQAKVFNQLGNIWADDLQNENKALEYYRKSLALKLKDNATPQSISASYNNIGLSHKVLGNQDSAYFYYEKALEYAELSGMPKHKANPLLNIGNYYKNVNRFEDAIKTYNEVLKLNEYINIRQQITTRINLGMIYNKVQNFREALKHLSVADELLVTTNSLSDKAEVAGHKAEALFGLKDFENAYIAQTRYKLYTDTIRTKEKEQQIADMMVKYEAAEKDNALLEQAQTIKESELKMQRRTTWLVSIIACVLLLAAMAFYLFKKKQEAEQRAKLELKLVEQKEFSRLQEERLRISRDLHDNIGSYLTLINASVEQFPSLSENELQQRLPEVQNSLAMSMRELRKTVWLLNKPKVTIEEIALRLRDFFKPLHQNGTRITVQANGNTEQTLSEIQTTHLFRIIQEAVNNAYKHASGKNITIELDAGTENTLLFSVADDGKGFDMKNHKSGNGLYNMKSRMGELHGELIVESELAKGTSVKGIFKI